MLVVLYFFMLVSPAIYNIWAGDQMTRIEAYRVTFEGTAVGFHDLDHPTLSNPAPSKPHGQGYYDNPEAADFSAINQPPGAPDPTELPNPVAESGAKLKVNYSAGFGPFDGSITLDRRAYTARSPWTWSSYPFVYSQHADEGDLVREWFEGVLEHTIDDDIAWSLQLGG